MAAKIRLLRPRTIVLLLLSAGFVAFGLYNMQQETKPRAKVLENKEFSLPAPHGGKHQPTKERLPATPAPSTTAPSTRSTSSPSLLTSATSRRVDLQPRDALHGRRRLQNASP
jgi:hypothetical protein